MMDSSSSTSWKMAAPSLGGLNWARFDFSDNSDYSGAAKGDGFAAKLGFTYQVNPALSVGGVYQSETNISDLTASGATVSAGMYGQPAAQTFHGKIKVRNFQWPTTYGVGLSFVPNDKWMVAADIKQLQWSEVMKNFKMTFSDPVMGDLNVTMPQHWKDQTVIQLGGAYKVNTAFTVRAGYNHSNNPVPNDYVNPLFPAIVENHYTAGFGYAFSKASEVNFSATYAPKVTVTGTGSMNKGIKISHSQTNWQLMYSHRF
jgi:long-chain fatty acid transport protein